jgi:hypothetical protein
LFRLGINFHKSYSPWLSMLYAASSGYLCGKIHNIIYANYCLNRLKTDNIVLEYNVVDFGDFFFLSFFFALKVDIYLKNMSIKRRLARFDQKAYFRCFCVWTLNASFNSIQRSCWWPVLILVLSKLSKTSFLFLYLTESVIIVVWPRVGFPSSDFFSRYNRLHACVVKYHIRTYE